MSDELHNYAKTGIVQLSDDIVTRLRAYNIGNIGHEASFHMEETLYEAADEIERLRAENDTHRSAVHQAIWYDILIPIADALGVATHDEHGVHLRQFQMVDAIIKAVRGE